MLCLLPMPAFALIDLKSNWSYSRTFENSLRAIGKSEYSLVAKLSFLTWSPSIHLPERDKDVEAIGCAESLLRFWLWWSWNQCYWKTPEIGRDLRGHRPQAFTQWRNPVPLDHSRDYSPSCSNLHRLHSGCRRLSLHFHLEDSFPSLALSIQPTPSLEHLLILVQHISHIASWERAHRQYNPWDLECLLFGWVWNSKMEMISLRILKIFLHCLQISSFLLRNAMPSSLVSAECCLADISFFPFGGV